MSDHAWCYICTLVHASPGPCRGFWEAALRVPRGGGGLWVPTASLRIVARDIEAARKEVSR